MSSTTYVALFRGINVGGNRVVPMQELRSAFERNDCADVRTYIQSGNVVFRSSMSDAARLALRLRAAVLDRHGFDPQLLVLTRRELERAIAGNPFSAAKQHPHRVHLFFLAARPKKPDLKSLNALRTNNERCELKGTVFYLYAPDGFGTSKLAKSVERFLGVQATARNWRTVTALLDLTTGTPQGGTQ